MGESRRYLTDDRDARERNELVISTGDNGDWYVGVAKEGEIPIRTSVRLCTSGGASSRCPGLTKAISDAFRAIGGETLPLTMDEQIEATLDVVGRANAKVVEYGVEDGPIIEEIIEAGDFCVMANPCDVEMEGVVLEVLDAVPCDNGGGSDRPEGVHHYVLRRKSDGKEFDYIPSRDGHGLLKLEDKPQCSIHGCEHNKNCHCTEPIYWPEGNCIALDAQRDVNNRVLDSERMLFIPMKPGMSRATLDAMTEGPVFGSDDFTIRPSCSEDCSFNAGGFCDAGGKEAGHCKEGVYGKELTPLQRENKKISEQLRLLTIRHNQVINQLKEMGLLDRVREEMDK